MDGAPAFLQVMLVLTRLPPAGRELASEARRRGRRIRLPNLLVRSTAIISLVAEKGDAAYRCGQQDASKALRLLGPQPGQWHGVSREGEAYASGESFTSFRNASILSIWFSATARPVS